MNYWVVALLVTCVAPDGNTAPCRIIENSIMDNSTIFLTEEKCLAYVEGSKRRTCVAEKETVAK
jgi:hypothetical protein